MRRSRCCVLVGVGLLLVGACASRKTEPSGPAVKVDPSTGTFDAFTSAAEPRALRWNTAEGNTVTLFAEKDELGGVKRITSLYVQDPAQVATGTGTSVELDADERVSRVIGPDGTVIRVSWLTNTSVGIKAVSGDGSAQATTSFDFAPPASTPPDEDDGSDDEWTARRVLGKQALGVPVDERISPRNGPAGAPDAGEPSAALVKVSVTRCKQPASAEEIENAEVILDTNVGPMKFPASPPGFVVRVPFPPAGALPLASDPPHVQKLCATIGTALVRACKDKAYAQKLEPSLCPTLAAAAASLGEGPKKAILDECTKALKNLDETCRWVNLSPPVLMTSGAVVCGRLRSALPMVFPGRDLVVKARATIAGAGTRESVGTLDLRAEAAKVGGPVPSLVVDFGSDTRIMPIETAPPHPVLKRPYTIKVRVLCAAGKQIRMPVLGSEPEPHTYRVEGNWTVTEPSQELTLEARGANEAGIRDQIWVVVDGVQQRYLSFVF
ncbi:MAG TPA: hypothetical protein VM925_38040 [Labilithrix sp.]|nr:hypothetical protein [Labilithrix sp.]